ncbi:MULTISPECIES: hypothetical protein [Gordonia]|uniref:hypothetical protein n=1 Tax=Gordonia TaxID=2053 RepID=UPI0013E38A8D|nr:MULTISPECIES: hypothetical protein [Gordonia]MCK8616621.1 hypothetical protein [Gordonia sp. C13]
MSAVERALVELWVPLPSEVQAVVEGRPRDLAPAVDLWWRDAMPPGVEAQIL